MSKQNIFNPANGRPSDIIEIIPSHYIPSHPIGNRYIVIDSLNGEGLDVRVVDEDGDYCDVVCCEDYKVIGNVVGGINKHLI